MHRPIENNHLFHCVVRLMQYRLVSCLKTITNISLYFYSKANIRSCKEKFAAF